MMQGSSSCACCPLCVLFGDVSFNDFCTFYNLCLFHCWLIGVLYIWIQIPCQLCYLQIFSPHCVGCFFSLRINATDYTSVKVDSVLWSTKVLHFDEVQFICFFLLLLVFLVSYLRNDCLILGHKNLFLCFRLIV